METCKLGDFDIYVNDGNYGNIYPNSDEFLDKGVPFISASDFEGKKFNYDGIKYISKDLHDKTLIKGHIKKDDIIIVVRGNGIGKVGMLKDNLSDCNINAQLAFIRNNDDKIDSDYLYYLLSSDYYYQVLKKFGSGSAQPQLPLNRLMKVPIKYDDNIDNQKKISNFLSNIDKKIINNINKNEKLSKLSKTIFEHYYMNYEFPSKEKKSYKYDKGSFKYNSELKKEIPNEWEVVKFGDIASFEKGKIPESLNNEMTDNYNSEYLTIDVVNGGISQYCSSKGMPLCNGETIMVMDGAASGDVYVGYNGVLGSTFSKITSKDERISNTFIYWFLKTNRLYYKKANTGSTIPHANKNFIEKIKLPIGKEIKDISNTLDNIQRVINENNIENNRLERLKRFILPLLMNGQASIN